jgi:hypothetical protein
VIATRSSDFNTIGNKHWFQKFSGEPKPGSLCEPQNFTQGDSFTTTYNLFQWNIFSTNVSNPLAASVSYAGTNLDKCDVLRIKIEANLDAWTCKLQPIVYCNDTEFPILMDTEYSATSSSISSVWQNIIRLDVQSVSYGPRATNIKYSPVRTVN